MIDISDKGKSNLENLDNVTNSIKNIREEIESRYGEGYVWDSGDLVIVGEVAAALLVLSQIKARIERWRLETKTAKCDDCSWQGERSELIQAGLNHGLCPRCEGEIVTSSRGIKKASE